MIISEYYNRNNDSVRIEYNPGNTYFIIHSLYSGRKVKVNCKVKEGYTIAINKRTISGNEGAKSVFCFLADCIKNDFMTVYVDRVLDKFYFI